MTPDQARSACRRALGNFETVTFRRYSGSTPSRTATNYADIPARVMEFTAEELVGPIVQGDRKLIVMHDDLVAANYPLPIPTGANSKIVVRGKEVQVKSVDGDTRRCAGECIAYDIVVGG